MNRHIHSYRNFKKNTIKLKNNKNNLFKLQEKTIVFMKYNCQPEFH